MGSDKDGELYKGIVSFMSVGLTDSIPYIIKVETQINREWLKGGGGGGGSYWSD